MRSRGAETRSAAVRRLVQRGFRRPSDRESRSTHGLRPTPGAPACDCGRWALPRQGIAWCAMHQQIDARAASPGSRGGSRPASIAHLAKTNRYRFPRRSRSCLFSRRRPGCEYRPPNRSALAMSSILRIGVLGLATLQAVDQALGLLDLLILSEWTSDAGVRDRVMRPVVRAPGP